MKTTDQLIIEAVESEKKYVWELSRNLETNHIDILKYEILELVDRYWKTRCVSDSSGQELKTGEHHFNVFDEDIITYHFSLAYTTREENIPTLMRLMAEEALADRECQMQQNQWCLDTARRSYKDRPNPETKKTLETWEETIKYEKINYALMREELDQYL